MADSSLQTRKSQWRKYFEFCIDLEVAEPLPASLETVLLYMAFLADRVKYSSLGGYLSALWQLHKLAGLPHVDPKTFEIEMTKRGIRRVIGDEVKQAPPATLKDLRLIFATLDMSRSMDVAFWLSVLLCFRGLLRKSNVMEPGMCVRRRDIMFYQGGISTAIYRTKTIQYRERSLLIPFIRTNNLFCIDAVTRRLLELVSYPSQDSQLAAYMVGPVWVRVSYAWYARRLRDLAKRLCLPALTSHSMRRGGATLLADSGFSLIEIKNLGDWKSMSVLNYLVQTDKAKWDLDNRIARRLFM